jgi:hypothetical protein
MAFKKFIKSDKFGNPFQVIGLKDEKNNGKYPKGYVELGNHLYKIEVSESKKDGVELWCKVTKVKKNPTHTSM